MSDKTDRELLELAAKAAGVQAFSYIDSELFGKGINTGEIDVPMWNPLLDDGDALRLAVKLRMCIDIKPTESVHSDSVFVGFGGHTRGGGRTGRVGDKGAYIAAITRRCIVRAAAAIGEGL